MIIKPATKNDIPKIFDLYKEVASIPGYLARLEEEIDLTYIETNICSALDNGVCLIAIDMQTDKITGVIHGQSPGIKCFQHVIGNITIAISPNFQGNGIGKRLFSDFISHIKNNKSNITRIELFARESNTKGINLYKSLGFEIEGRLRKRVQNLDETREDDLVMGLVL